MGDDLFSDAVKQLATQDRPAEEATKAGVRRVADVLSEQKQRHARQVETVREELRRGAGLTKHRISL
jgi:hypothetical protein